MLPYPPGSALQLVQHSRFRRAQLITPEDYRLALARLRSLSLRHACAIHAYALLPDQLQLLVTGLLPDGLARMRRDLDGLGGSSGLGWFPLSESRLVTGEKEVLACLRAIEQAPARAGRVSCACAYPWSSYALHADGIRDPLINPHRAWLALGRTARERCASYRAFFRSDPAASFAIAAPAWRSCTTEAATGPPAPLPFADAGAMIGP